MAPSRALVIICFGLAAVLAGRTYSQTETLDQTFAEVRELRARGDFDGAIALLSDLIKTHSKSEAVLRKAYNDLVFTYYSKWSVASDAAQQDSLYADIVESAQSALSRFPDLNATTQEYPNGINLIYETRRELMFGRVEVTSTADSLRVFLKMKDASSKEVYQGITPLVIPYVPVGDYTLTVTRSGYKDREVPLSVGPSSVVQREVSLSKERTRRWWLTRVVVPVTAGAAAIAAIIVGSQDDTTNPTQPLDEPPPPPAQ